VILAIIFLWKNEESLPPSDGTTFYRMNEETFPDWIAAVRWNERSQFEEFDLNALRPGDRLWIWTDNTVYAFEMHEGREATLKTNRPDRPSGRVRINGCAIGVSSSIKPDCIFFGGNLEFIDVEGGTVSTTTPIRAMRLAQIDRSNFDGQRLT